MAVDIKSKLKIFWPLAVILGCLVFFYHEFMAGKVFGWDDDLYVFFPSASYFATSIKDGVFPFWLPGLRAGMPFYSDVQMGVFYPLKWLLVLFVKDGELSQQAYQCYLVFQYFIGGALFYKLMRMHGQCRTSSLAGSMVFLFSGFAALHIIFFASVEVVLWMPLVLIAIKHYFDRKSSLRALLISFAVLMTFLPGFPQVTLYLSYFAIAYWMVLAIYGELEKQAGWKSVCLGLLREVVIIGATFILAVVMGAVVFLPAFENWQYSHRADYGYDEVADTSMPFYYLVHLFFPNFTGVMHPTGSEVPYWGFNRDTLGFERYNAGYWQYWALSCYAGQIGIVAFLYSITFIRSHWKNPLRLACTVGAVFALWFMLGRYGGLYRVLYEVLPGISAFRGPGRMACVFNTAQAILVVFFIRDLISGERIERIRRFLLVIVGVYILFLAAFLLFGKSVCPMYQHEQLYDFSLRQIGVGIFFGGIIAVASQLIWRTPLRKYHGVILGALLLSVFLDLFSAHGGFHKGKTRVADYFSDRSGLVAKLEAFTKQNGPFRFGQVRDGKLNESVIMPRNMGYLHDVEFPEGYVLFVPTANYRIRRNLPPAAVIDLLNVGVMAEQNSKGVQIRVNNTALPRAAFYGNVGVFNSRDELFEAVSSGSSDYQNQVAILAEDAGDLEFNNSEPRVNCTTAKVNNNAWRISYKAPDRGVIFVSQLYYPGWKAVDADGKEYKVIETFGALTGIIIPEEGSGEIMFRFFPAVFVKGFVISCLSIALASGIILYLVWKRRKLSPTNSE